MPLMMSALYEALRSANVPDELARKAAEEAASFEQRFANIDRELSVLRWMSATTIGLVLVVLGRVFFPR